MTTHNTEQRNDAVMREAGWRVAVHNDYRLNGEDHTFWLFTHPNGRWVKGEGRTDDDALAECVAAISQPPASSPLEGEVRERLRIMSKQKLSDEMDSLDQADADWQGAYDYFCTESRAIFAALSTEAGSGEVRAWEYESPDGKERLVRCRRATAGEFPYWTERALTYAVAVAEAGKPASAVNEADVRHLAFILEEWDMKPRPNEWTGHAYEDIARDALARLAISSQPSDNQKMREVLAAIKAEAAAATSSDGKERDPWAIGRVLKMASAALAQSVEGGEG